MNEKNKRLTIFALSAIALFVGGYFLSGLRKDDLRFKDDRRIEGTVLSVESNNDLVTVLARMDSFLQNPSQETIELNILIKDDTLILFGNDKREHPMDISDLEPGDPVIIITNEPLSDIQEGSEYSAKAIKKFVEEVFSQRLDARISSIEFEENGSAMVTALVEINSIIPNHPEEFIEVKISLTEETLAFFGNSKREYPMDISDLEPGDPVIIITNEPLSDMQEGSEYSAKAIKKFVADPETLLNL